MRVMVVLTESVMVVEEMETVKKWGTRVRFRGCT